MSSPQHGDAAQQVSRTVSSTSSLGSRKGSRRGGRRRHKPGAAAWLKAASPVFTARQGVATTLGLEMHAFCEYAHRCVVAMNPGVDSLLGGLRNAGQKLWPGSTMELYGSVAQGLHLPSSDVDIILTVSTLARTAGSVPQLRPLCCDGCRRSEWCGAEGSSSTVFPSPSCHRSPQRTSKTRPSALPPTWWPASSSCSSWGIS